jgi:hypothetical protein
MFSNNKIKLLEKGPKYNLHSNKKNWLITLALEAETAIMQLPIADRDYYRKQVADHIEELRNNSNPHNNTHPESITLKSIQAKLKINKAMTASADKGNSIVVLPIQQYEAKIHNFINKNNFQISTSNPTKTFQNQIKKTIYHSPILIPPDSK